MKVWCVKVFVTSEEGSHIEAIIIKAPLAATAAQFLQFHHSFDSHFDYISSRITNNGIVIWFSCFFVKPLKKHGQCFLWIILLWRKQTFFIVSTFSYISQDSTVQ